MDLYHKCYVGCQARGEQKRAKRQITECHANQGDTGFISQCQVLLCELGRHVCPRTKSPHTVVHFALLTLDHDQMTVALCQHMSPGRKQMRHACLAQEEKDLKGTLLPAHAEDTFTHFFLSFRPKLTERYKTIMTIDKTEMLAGYSGATDKSNLKLYSMTK